MNFYSCDASVSESRQKQIIVILKNKLTSVFNESVLLPTINFVMTLSKLSADSLGYRLVDLQQL